MGRSVKAVGEASIDVADVVILLEVAQGENPGTLWDASSLSLRPQMPCQTLVRKLAVLEKCGYVMKKKRERRVAYEVARASDADNFPVGP